MSGTAPAAPLFATVSFVNEHSGTEHQTFRVPIDATTTVKALAKSALFRLGQQQKVAHLGIREIYVGAQQVKLFIHDVVMHVVSVSEERVVLVLKDKTSGQLPLPPPPVPTEPCSPPMDDGQRSRSDTQPAPALAACHIDVPEKSPSPVFNAEHQLEIVSRKLQRRSKSPALSRVSSSETTAVSSSSLVKKASQVQNMPAAVAVASPRPIERPTSMVVGRQSKGEISPKKRPRTGDDVLTPEVAKVTRVEELTAADRSQFIQQKSQEGWGPEAYRNFESNYTSDPDKLARELRKQRALAARASKVVAIDCDVDTITAQQTLSTTTIPRKVSARSPIAVDHTSKTLFDAASNTSPLMIVDDDENTGSVSRPTGWGVKASKFFDACTYHDDPSKAKLDPALLNEPVRARRSTQRSLFHN